MTPANDIIRDRPAFLEALPFYRKLPKKPVLVDVEAFPELLRLDMMFLEGLLPISRAVSDLCPDGIDTIPSKEVVDHYQAQGTRFQMVMMVCNTFGWSDEGERIRARPYSLSLLPASKRGEIDWRDPALAALLVGMERQTDSYVYADFNPFVGSWGLWLPYGMAVEANNSYTDSIGFVLGAYFLANTLPDPADILLPGLSTASDLINRRYRRARISRYFQPLETLTPRRVWGAASPIELLLIHGLAARGYFPQIQSLIYPNGEVFPSLYDRLLDKLDAGEEDRGARPITEADLYFPKERLAVFCDSTTYHRGPANKERDARITAELEKLDFRVLRVTGHDLTRNLEKCVDAVAVALK